MGDSLSHLDDLLSTADKSQPTRNEVSRDALWRLYNDCNIHCHKMTVTFEEIRINRANDYSEYGISECNFTILRSFIVFFHVLNFGLEMCTYYPGFV